MQTRLPILHETLLSCDIKTRELLAINEDVYTSLTNYLSKEDISKTAQPNLVVGESGSGKTFLMKRLYGRIKEDMGNVLHPIVIEGKTLFSTDDIWIQCVSQLDLEQGDDCFDTILKWQELHLKRIVLFIDNIQYYFERTENAEQYGLRGKLNRAGSPILIASTEQVLPAFTEYDAAFFDGFKITYLKPLSMSAIEDFTKGKYDLVRLENIMSYMPKTIRSMFIAIEIMDKSDDSEKDLAFLSDHFFSHYQEKFDGISIQTQRILSALSQSDSGLTLSEIRDITRQDNGKISPYLKLMADHKFINRESKTLRGGSYFIIDPLFQLWLRHNTAPTHKNR